MTQKERSWNVSQELMNVPLKKFNFLCSHYINNDTTVHINEEALMVIFED